MADFHHIVEPEPDPEVYTAGPPNEEVSKSGDVRVKGKATIIQGSRKCNRLHCEWVWICLGTLAAFGLAVGGVALLIMALPR
ncbi:MAG: hypothetical protein IH897_13195 [Planctomycetes bacterium]|nr:hypothetical protein [Planctomycetota bacterium]